MSADTRLEELGMSGLGEVDEPAFSALAERHRRELHVHCYRMLGSFEDAEDTVQETFLRAWRRRETFEGRSDVPGLAVPHRHQRLPGPARQAPPAGPPPAARCRGCSPTRTGCSTSCPRTTPDAPETVAVARETIELAYLVAVQHLRAAPAGCADPARRARLARQGRRGPARGLASTPSNSALQRARAGMREHLPAERQDWTGGEEDAGTRELVRRFTEASVATDIAAITALLRDDVRCSMPPTPGLYVGRDAVVADWVADGFERLDGSTRRPHRREPAARRRLLPLARRRRTRTCR